MCLMNINNGNIEEIRLQKQKTILKISTGFWMKRIITNFFLLVESFVLLNRYTKKKIIIPNQGLLTNNMIIKYYIIQKYFLLVTFIWTTFLSLRCIICYSNVLYCVLWNVLRRISHILQSGSFPTDVTNDKHNFCNGTTDNLHFNKEYITNSVL